MVLISGVTWGVSRISCRDAGHGNLSPRSSTVGQEGNFLLQLRGLSFPGAPEKHQDSEGHEGTGKPLEESSPYVQNRDSLPWKCKCGGGETQGCVRGAAGGRGGLGTKPPKPGAGKGKAGAGELKSSIPITPQQLHGDRKCKANKCKARIVRNVDASTSLSSADAELQLISGTSGTKLGFTLLFHAFPLLSSYKKTKKKPFLLWAWIRQGLE